MMYHNKFVVAIKVGGRVLRETGSLVNLPFGSEYSVLLKNLNSVRALASVSVDGADATDGTKLILEANDSVEIERYIRNGNFERGNRFKFIERTEEIEEHKGIGADDGLVRVEFWPEKLTPSYTHFPSTYAWPLYPTQTFFGGMTVNSTPSRAGIRGSSNMLCSSAPHTALTASCNTASLGDTPVKAMDILGGCSHQGITVPGSESGQKFITGSWFPTETQSEVLVLQLRGEVGGRQVPKPITVERKPMCNTCGRTNPATANFCLKCGTALRLF